MMANIYSIVCVFLNISILLQGVFAAPNCDLKAIFRTPRDFDDFEILERSSFDPVPEKCLTPSEDKPKEDPTRSFANAQILLRIGHDRDAAENHPSDPCIPVSKLLNVPERTLPSYLGQHHHQHQPVSYQQASNSYTPQVPYVFPNYLYYNPIQTICQHLIPLLKELRKVSKEAVVEDSDKNDASKSVDQVSEKPSIKEVSANEAKPLPENSAQNAETVNVAQNKIDSASSDIIAEEGEKQSAIDTPPEVLEPVEISNEIQANPDDAKEDKDDILEKQPVANSSDDAKDNVNNKIETHIQKINANKGSETIDFSPLLEEGEDGKFISLSAIKLEHHKKNLEDNDDSEKPDGKATENCISFHIFKLPIKPKEAYQNSTISDTSKLLQEALIPISCPNCDEDVKNAISYPIFYKGQKDKDDIATNKITLDVEDCNSCNSPSEDGLTRKYGFRADIDDLSLMKGKPITQSSILRNYIPRYLKQILESTESARLLPVLSKPAPKYVTYGTSSYLPQQYLQNYLKCACKQCVCDPQGAVIVYQVPQYSQPEPKYQETQQVVVRYVPNYAKGQNPTYYVSAPKYQEVQNQIIRCVPSYPKEQNPGYAGLEPKYQEVQHQIIRCVPSYPKEENPGYDVPEPKYQEVQQEVVRCVPSYPKGQYEVPVQIVTHGAETNADNDNEEVLIPVAVIPEDVPVDGRCKSCTPYVKEFNE